MSPSEPLQTSPPDILHRPSRRLGTRFAALALTTVLASATVVGCGDDDGGTVREEGATSGSASGSGSATGSEVACEPVGDPADADSTVEVELDEWSVSAPDTIAAGTVDFEATNVGDEPHELVIVRAESLDDLPRDADGEPDEDAVAEEDFIGEIEPFPAGETCNGVFDLDPGNYVLYCAIVEEHDGEPVSHFQNGMNRLVTAE